MPEEQLTAFLEKAEGDKELQEKLKATDDADAVVVTAKDAGFIISVDELKKARAKVSENEMEDLEWWRVLKNLCKLQSYGVLKLK